MDLHKKEVLEFVKTNNLIGIKAGKNRETFIQIWMVVVDNRIFARSWGLSEKSWYNIFLAEHLGQINCDNIICNIKALVPVDIDTLADRINQAYLNKYNYGRNTKYAQGIIQQKHIDKTMEFEIV